MAYTVTIEVPKVQVEEELKREKIFLEAAQAAAASLSNIGGLAIPLAIQPGKRVKSKKEMLLIEKPAIESRRPQTVRRRGNPQKKEKVEQKIKKMVHSAESSTKAQKQKPTKKQKKQRPGKSKRQKVSSKRKQ